MSSNIKDKKMRMKIRQSEKEEKNFLAKYQSLTISIETINLVLLTLLAKIIIKTRICHFGQKYLFGLRERVGCWLVLHCASSYITIQTE